METVKKEVQITRGEKFKTPSVPNFIKYADRDFTIPIHEFSDDELITIAEIWKENLLASARNKRK